MNTLLATGVAIVGTASISSAAIVYEQNFETLNAGGLTVFPYNGESLSGQDGFGGTAAPMVKVVNIGGISYSGGSINVAGGNNSVRVDTWNPGEPGFNRAIAAQTGDVYFSYTYRLTNFDTGDFHWFMFGNSTATNNNTLGVTSRNGGLFPRIRDGADSFNGTGSNIVDGDYLLVGRISKSGGNGGNYDTLHVWVNPTSDTLGSATISNTANSGINTISSFRFIVGSASDQLDGGDVVGYDNLRIGTTLGDVLIIPEPASLGLLGLTTMALGRRRRS